MVRSSHPRLTGLREEVGTALDALGAADAATEPLDVLAQITIAIERLNATQHELVNLLLDEGVAWTDIGWALDTSSTAAERRFPRRTSS